MSGTGDQREPPETTTGMLEDELTLDDGELEGLLDAEEDVVGDALEDVLEDALEEGVALPAEEDVLVEVELVDAEPGMVVAATPARTPTPANAPTTTHVVIAFRLRIALSLAWI